MDLQRGVMGVLLVVAIFIAFGLAFGVEIKYYIGQSDIDNLENLGKEYVTGARPSFIGQVFFFISTFWAIVKTSFTFLTVGVKAMIFDVGGMFNVPVAILTLISAMGVFLIAYEALKRLRGSGG